MNMNWPAQIAGGAAGLANGLFGGGGGMVFLPILSGFGRLEAAEAVRHLCGCDFPGVSGIRRRIYLSGRRVPIDGASVSCPAG